MWELFRQIVRDPVLRILCGLIGFLIGNRLSLDREKIKGYNIAAQAFREALKSELFYFSPDVTGFVFAYNILIDSEKKHITAFNEFFFHIPYMKRRRFTKAWDAYMQARNVYDPNADPQAIKQMRLDIYKNLSILMSHAKPS